MIWQLETFLAQKVFISFSAGNFTRSDSTYLYLNITIDGVEKIESKGYSGSTYHPGYIQWVEDLPAGSHTIKVQWKVSGGTGSQPGTTYKRVLTVITGQ